MTQDAPDETDLSGRAAAATPTQGPRAGAPAPDPVAELRTTTAGLTAALVDYLHATSDGVRAKIASVIVRLLLGAIAALALLAAVITAVVLVLSGAAGGLATMLHVSTWVGNLLVGGAVLIALLIGRWVYLRRRARRLLVAARERYAQRDARTGAQNGQTHAD